MTKPHRKTDPGRKANACLSALEDDTFKPWSWRSAQDADQNVGRSQQAASGLQHAANRSDQSVAEGLPEGRPENLPKDFAQGLPKNLASSPAMTATQSAAQDVAQDPAQWPAQEAHEQRSSGLSAQISVAQGPTSQRLVDDPKKPSVAKPDRRANQSGDALRLIAAVSHEMRNPLNGILGMAHLLGDTKLDAAQRSYLDAISSSGEVLLTLVNDLLDLSALRTGALALNTAPTKIAVLLEQCVELVAPSAHHKGLTLGSTISPVLTGVGEHPVSLTLDGGRLRQVVTNLLSNAIKFTDQGGVRLRATRVQTERGDQLQIDVEDTGHGIAQADQDLVFAPFGRTDTALQDAIEGTGLGLPLSRGMAHAMKGTLTIHRSAPGQGTQMRLRVPLDVADLDAIDTAPFTKPLTGQRVMLVLSPELGPTPEGAALADTLESLGASVQLCCDPEALSGAPKDTDHVLVDARFDHAMLWARLCLPPARLRPIILLRPDHRSVLQGLQEAGFCGYLIRPVRQSSLHAMLTHRFDASAPAPFLPDPVDTETTRDTAICKVLLVDDNAINALLAKTALEKAGHHVVVADNGAQALEQMEAEASSVDVTLLDLSMPGMDGFETAKAMRAGGYGGRLIAYTGNTDPQLHARTVEAGFDAVAQKPLKPDALLALLDGAGSAPTP